jgi:hypothetical protein
MVLSQVGAHFLYNSARKVLCKIKNLFLVGFFMQISTRHLLLPTVSGAKWGGGPAIISRNEAGCRRSDSFVFATDSNCIIVRPISLFRNSSFCPCYWLSRSSGFLSNRRLHGCLCINQISEGA